jgi:cobalt-zinc-cadmium efflux system membrane fusion protein
LRNKTALITIALSLVATLFVGCDKQNSTDTNTTEKNGVEGQKKNDIQLYKAVEQNVTLQVTAPGQVFALPDGMVNITSTVSGSVDKVFAHIGEKVSQGTPLLLVKSPDTSDATTSLLMAKSSLTEAKRLYDLNKELYAIGSISKNDFLASEQSLQQSQAQYEGTKRKLSLYGAQGASAAKITAPIGGVVYEMNVHVGDKVQFDPNNALMKIADPNKKTIIANVNEGDISHFKQGSNVTIELQNGEKIKGVVQYIAEAVDLDSKTMKVYVNPSEKMADLKINMFVKIYGDIEFKGIKIPKSAILNKDGKLYVFISKDSKFIEHEIKIFEDDKDENYSIINGLEPGSLIAQDTIMLDKP